MEKWRSKELWQSLEAAGGRTTFKAGGLTDEDFKRPFVGIANTWAEMGPGHMHLRQIAEVVKAGVWQAGGVPLEFGNMAQCPNMVEGLHGIRFDTATREIVSFSIEAAAELHMFDALIMIGTCDKIIPAFLLAAARLDLPTIIVPGGPMKAGRFRGKEIMSDLLMVEGYAMAMGKSGLSRDEFTEMEDCICPSAGACAVLGTANTGQCMAEALGLALPGAGTALATSSKRLRLAKNSGRKIMDLIKQGISARDILTEKSLVNGIKLLHALGGSTNTILHLLALSHELSLDEKINLSLIEKLGEEIPCITAVQPSGPFTMGDMDEAGGVGAVLKQIEEHLDPDVMTVTGETLGDTVEALIQGRADVAISQMQEAAAARGLDTMTMDEIDAIIADVRREMREQDEAAA